MKKILLSETLWGGILLAGLIFAIFILPLLPVFLHGNTTRVMYSILYFSAIMTLEKRYKSIFYIAILAFLMEWIAGIFSLWILSVVSRSVNIIFFFITVVFLINQVARAKDVNVRVVISSVTGYFLIGLMFSLVVTFILNQDPDAFNIPAHEIIPGERLSHLSESVYFSFVTFATLGYGDITPLKPYSRSLAIFIAVCGQLYVTIIIALIVGKFLSKVTNRNTEAKPDQ